MKNRLQWSKLYSFCCSSNPSVKGDASVGFSRVVYCNQPALNVYPSNYVSTTKYSMLSFLPKALFEQFRRVANIYFLFAAVLSLTPLTPFLPASLLAPLIFVMGVSILKEGHEDFRRYKQDKKVNGRQVMVHTGTGEFDIRQWQQLQVGDIVMVEKDDFFPADLLLISSCFDDGICYVETMNLDGETNLKVKQSLDITADMMEVEHFKTMRGLIRCEDPNNNLYTFVGTVDIEDQVRPLGPQQILLRDSKLRNTDFIFGVVIFSGHDTKVMQNATRPPSKRSKIERKMDRIIYGLFTVLILISSIGSVAFGVRSKKLMPDWWYLFPSDASIFYDPKKAAAVAFLHLVTALILYGYLIPISLYVSIELVKVVQASFINMDHQLYHPVTNRPARARTSNLNEELGQVDTILSDKTGTLTCNLMNFLKCSVAGTPYGRGVTEVERCNAKRLGREEDDWEPEQFQEESDHEKDGSGDLLMPPIKGFSFKDERLMDGKWIDEPNSQVLQIFFRMLAVCQTAIPEEDYQTGLINYEAESPDEAAFVVAAREFGFTFFKRTQTSVFVMEPDVKEPVEPVEREYKILNLLEFSSDRKRMSVITRTQDNQIYLFCKGADSVIFERLGRNGHEFEEATRGHLSKYADAGLRTLVLAYRKLEEAEYSKWNQVFQTARTTVGAHRTALLEAASELIEKDLILVGATAVEDKLQQGVPECIERLAQAGINIWVLTGDKLETAINIGFACSLLRQGMKQILITSEQIALVDVPADKEAAAKAYKAKVEKEMRLGQVLIDSEKDEALLFALIIDGKALDLALEDDLKLSLLKLASGCASVICCRVSPLQKALVTRLVRRGTGRTTLSIGDGANDVGMIQEADIGVGISGVEGMQAVMASDFSIAQFRFLERLLLVHGHWCYKRISLMICYFFYKNVAFGLTLFYYEAHTGFSGQTVYNDWTMSLFNVLFTSLPVMVLGILEQDISAKACLQYPALYQQGPNNLLFCWTRILCWLLNSFYSSTVAFFFTRGIYKLQSFRKDGKTASLDAFGTSMYTCIIWTLCIQIALATSYFTWLQHLSIWGSIVLWYSFLLLYGSLTPSISTTGYRVLLEVLAPSSAYWLATLLVPIACVFPYFTLQAVQRMFRPMDHHIVHEIRRKQRCKL